MSLKRKANLPTLLVLAAIEASRAGLALEWLNGGTIESAIVRLWSDTASRQLSLADACAVLVLMARADKRPVDDEVRRASGLSS